MSCSPRQTARMQFSEYLMLTLVILCLLWHFVRLVEPSNLSAYEAYFPMLWGGLAALMGRRGQTWQRKSFWLLLGSFFYILLRCMADGPTVMRNNTKDVFNALLVFGVYYQLSFGFTAEQMKSFLRVTCSIWVLMEVVLSLVGLWIVLYDQVIPSLAGANVLGLRNQRLSLFFYPTITSSNLTVSIVLACMGLFVARHTISRILFALSLLVMWIALGLSATRSGYLTIGMAVGMCLSLPMLRWMRAHTHIREWLLRGLCLVLTGTLVVVAYFSLNATIPLFNMVQSSVHAQAETAEAIPTDDTLEGQEDLLPVDTVQQRPLQFDSHLLTERQYIWMAIFHYFQDNPSSLIFGLGLSDPMEPIMPYLEGSSISYPHAHCIYLQVLLVYGLVGLVCLLLFLWLLVRASLCLFFAKDLPLWQCALPVLPALALVTDLMECFLLLDCNYPALSFTLLFAGLVFRFTPDRHDLLPARAKGDAHAQAV